MAGQVPPDDPSRAGRLEPVAQGPAGHGQPTERAHPQPAATRKRSGEEGAVGRLRVRRPHGSTSNPIRQFPPPSHEKTIRFHRQNGKSSSPLLLPVRFPLAAGGRVVGGGGRVFPYSNPPHRGNKSGASDRWGVGSTWWRAPCLPRGRLDLVGFSNQAGRRGGLRAVVSRGPACRTCVASASEARGGWHAAAARACVLLRITCSCV